MKRKSVLLTLATMAVSIFLTACSAYQPPSQMLQTDMVSENEVTEEFSPEIQADEQLFFHTHGTTIYYCGNQLSGTASYSLKFHVINETNQNLIFGAKANHFYTAKGDEILGAYVTGGDIIMAESDAYVDVVLSDPKAQIGSMVLFMYNEYINPSRYWYYTDLIRMDFLINKVTTSGDILRQSVYFDVTPESDYVNGALSEEYMPEPAPETPHSAVSGNTVSDNSTGVSQNQVPDTGAVTAFLNMHKTDTPLFHLNGLDIFLKDISITQEAGGGGTVILLEAANTTSYDVTLRTHVSTCYDSEGNAITGDNVVTNLRVPAHSVSEGSMYIVRGESQTPIDALSVSFNGDGRAADSQWNFVSTPIKIGNFIAGYPSVMQYSGGVVSGSENKL